MQRDPSNTPAASCARRECHYAEEVSSGWVERIEFATLNELCRTTVHFWPTRSTRNYHGSIHTTVIFGQVDLGVASPKIRSADTEVLAPRYYPDFTFFVVQGTCVCRRASPTGGYNQGCFGTAIAQRRRKAMASAAPAARGPTTRGNGERGGGSSAPTAPPPLHTYTHMHAAPQHEVCAQHAVRAPRSLARSGVLLAH